MEELITRLAALDKQEQPPYLQAIGLEYFGRGGSEAWRATVQNGDLYVVKTQNNGQDRNQVRMGDEPLKILTTDLICGRLRKLSLRSFVQKWQSLIFQSGLRKIVGFPTGGR